jgi:superfamily II DNA or RNA helicase
MSFQKGDTVARRSVASETGVVVDGPKVRRGQTWYTVFFGGRRENVLAEDLQPVAEGGTIRDLFLQGAFGDERSFSRLLTLARINEPVRDTIYSYQASRTELHGYQYRPLLKYLNSPFRRILIADEVGLGKTIEAAYIFQEERARHNLQRVLVLCPASLRVKWQNELHQRFGERFDLLDAGAVRRRLTSSAAQDGLDQRLFGIVSYETIRSRNVREILDESPPSIDLLIADEIHHCRNRETHNFRVVRTLAENSDSVVFLSATPVHTGNDNLFNLMNLLLPERFDVDVAFQRQLKTNRHVVRAESFLCTGTAEGIRKARQELELLPLDETGRGVTQDPFYPIVMENLRSPDIAGNTPLLVETQEMLAGLNLLGDVLTRTRKRDVQEGSATRVAYAHTPALSEYEQLVYDTISTFIFIQYEKQYDSAVARFVLSGLQRQFASSLYAAVSHYRDAFELNDEEQVEPGLLDIEEADFEQDSEGPDDEAHYSLKQDPEFREIIRSISVTRLFQEDSKYRALAEILKESGKVIVFAFYKRSLRYLQERMGQENIKTVRIDGDVPSNPESPDEDERVRRIRQFRDDPTCKVMLSSQVGSEGLDFQFCDTIVNWDLPWNPMVVEQRIGRIDRLGQKSERIFIHNLVSHGTIEELILSRLYQRIGIFRDSIGELEPILGPVITQLTRDLFSPRLTREEKEQSIIRSAHAVERERAYVQALEKDSAQLIGHDEVIRQKIDKIKHLGRFLTGKELEIFVGEFLARQFPASRLYSEGGREGEVGDGLPRWLRIAPELRQFVVERVRRTDQEGQRLVQLMRRDVLKVVFDAEAAMAHPDGELIHSHHALVRLIATFYGMQPLQMHRVNALQLRTDTIAPGAYFYGWASVDERGAFHSRHLLMGLIRIPAGEPVVDAETCERLLHEMVVDGQPWGEGLPSCDRGATEALYDWFEEHAAAHAEQYRTKRNREAEAVVLRQLQAIEASFRVKRERREKAIMTAKASGRSDTVIRLQNDQIRKLEADFDLKRAELQAAKTVDVGYRIEGVGWLRAIDRLQRGEKDA